MKRQREEEEAARRRALDGMTPDERAAQAKAEADKARHEESQMAHLKRINRTLVTGTASSVLGAGGRGRGRGRGGA